MAPPFDDDAVARPTATSSAASTCSCRSRSSRRRTGCRRPGPVMLGVGAAEGRRQRRDARTPISTSSPPQRGRWPRIRKTAGRVAQHRPRRAGAGDRRRNVAAGAAAAVRVGRRRAADRVRQRQPAAAGARDRSPEGDRAARGARREPRRGHPSADGRSGADGGRPRRRSASCSDAGRWPAWRGCSRRRCRSRRTCRSTARVLLFTGGVAVAGRDAVRAGAGAARRRGPTSAACCRPASAARPAPGAGLRDVLVVVEMALSVALVAVSALLIQSLLAVQQVPLGFDPSNVFTLQFRLPQSKYSKPEDIARFFKSAIENVRAVPGVRVGGAGAGGAVQRQRRHGRLCRRGKSGAGSGVSCRRRASTSSRRTTSRR